MRHNLKAYISQEYKDNALHMSLNEPEDVSDKKKSSILYNAVWGGRLRLRRDIFMIWRSARGTCLTTMDAKNDVIRCWHGTIYNIGKWLGNLFVKFSRHFLLSKMAWKWNVTREYLSQNIRVELLKYLEISNLDMVNSKIMCIVSGNANLKNTYILDKKTNHILVVRK